MANDRIGRPTERPSGPQQTRDNSPVNARRCRSRSCNGGRRNPNKLTIIKFVNSKGTTSDLPVGRCLATKENATGLLHSARDILEPTVSSCLDWLRSKTESLDRKENSGDVDYQSRKEAANAIALKLGRASEYEGILCFLNNSVKLVVSLGKLYPQLTGANIVGSIIPGMIKSYQATKVQMGDTADVMATLVI